MESLIFLTEKRDWIIKRRACANESIQLDCMDTEELSIPKVSLWSVIFKEFINAHKDREVTIVYISNAFIQTDNPKKW